MVGRTDGLVSPSGSAGTTTVNVTSFGKKLAAPSPNLAILEFRRRFRPNFKIATPPEWLTKDVRNDSLTHLPC